MLKTLAVAAGLILAGGWSFADVAAAGDGRHGHSGSHGQFHDHLDHNEFHRQLDHRQAHRYPMSPWQHGQLHDNLDHDRYHDQLQHRQYHRSYSYPSSSYYRSYRPVYPSYGRSYGYSRGGIGLGISPYGFSLRIGR